MCEINDLNDVLVPVHITEAGARLRSAVPRTIDVKNVFFTFFTSMPRTYISRYGPFSFRLSAPTAWTELKDSDISRTQVKSGRKTWLFERA